VEQDWKDKAERVGRNRRLEQNKAGQRTEQNRAGAEQSKAVYRTGMTEQNQDKKTGQETNKTEQIKWNSTR
jgi:hypothetical protein